MRTKFMITIRVPVNSGGRRGRRLSPGLAGGAGSMHSRSAAADAAVNSASRDTIRRATSELAGEGLLVVLHGRGTFVVEH